MCEPRIPVNMYMVGNSTYHHSLALNLYGNRLASTVVVAKKLQACPLPLSVSVSPVSPMVVCPEPCDHRSRTHSVSSKVSKHCLVRGYESLDRLVDANHPHHQHTPHLNGQCSSSRNSFTHSSTFDLPKIQLPNGLLMPMLGLGTTHSGGYYHDTVVHALKECNYRSIDTAKRYGVENEIGLAIKESGVPREQIFLTSKLWPVDFGYASTVEACKASCKRLGSNYLDLYLIHFPEVPRWFSDPKTIKEETWRALEHLYEQGVCRSIGVSNYNVAQISEVLEYCSIRPHVNQCEYHPYINPKPLIQFCKDEHILFSGYCPLGKGAILKEEPIQQLANKYSKTPAQICLRWSVQNGVPAIPKSRNKYRVWENTQIFDFSLDASDMQSLDCLHDESRKCVKLGSLQEKFCLPDGYKLNK